MFAAFVDVCARIGPREAKIVSMLYGKNYGDVDWSIPFGVSAENRVAYQEPMQIVSNKGRVSGTSEAQSVLDRAMINCRTRFAELSCVTVGMKGKYFLYPMNEMFGFGVHDSIDILSRLDLVDRINLNSDADSFFEYVQLTRFGYSLARHCLSTGVHID